MREVKPTQKPVPSSDIKDLFFNSGLLDIWATSLEHKYIDRFGNCHLTASGMEWIFNELVTKFKIESEQALLAAGYAPSGTFQEGAEVVSRNGTVLWKLPDGDGDHYRWDGDLPKQVPAGSTPQSTGGIGKGAWVSVGDASLRSDLKNGDGSLIGVGSGTLKDLIESMQYIDFNSFSLGRNDKSQAFIEFIEKCNLENKKAVGDLTGVVVSSPLAINNGFSFDGVVTFIGDGRLTCINEPYAMLPVNAQELTQGAISPSSLSGLSGMVFINTKTRLMKRMGLDEIVHYGEINYVDNGVLRHPLNDDYSTKQGVEIRFLPKQIRPKIRCKISVAVESNVGHVLVFNGSNFDAHVELIKAKNTAQYSNFVRFEYCHSFSYTLTAHQSMGTPTHTAYDAYMLLVYGVDINQPTAPTDSGWKTIDGTHFRNVTLNGGSIYAFHSHWNGCDVVVNGGRATKAFSFASHIQAGMYDINAVVTNDNTFVGCRADYGFLAGSLNLSGKLLHNKQNSGAIYRHVTDLHVDPDNVGVVFKMPKHVHMNIALLGGRAGEEVSLIETRNPDQTSSYIPWGKLSGSVDYSGFNGNPVLRVAMTTVSNHVFKVDLKQCLDNGSAMRLEIGKQDQSILMSDNVNVNITIRDSKVSCSSQTVGNRKILFARGELNVIGGEMAGLFSSINQYSVPVGGKINLESCIWKFNSVSEWAGTNLLAKYTTLSNVTFDGSNIEQLFTKAGFWVSASHGCKAINLDLANDFAMYAPRSNAINASTKKMAPINGRGMLDNFDRDFVATKL
ncbi:hypothetical protein ABZ131_02640 [Providencia rettgeri]